MPVTTIVDKLQQLRQMISTKIQAISEMTSDEVQAIIDSAIASIDAFGSKLTDMDEQTDNDGKITIPQFLKVLNETNCPKINSLLLGWVQMLDAPLVITEVQSFMSTNGPVYIASMQQMIEDNMSDIREYTETLVDVYSDGLEQFRAGIFSDYKSMTFNGIGPNDNGEISAAQLREYMSQLPLTDEEISQFIANADSEGNGEINYAQFAAAMRGKYLAKSIMSAFFENVSDYVGMTGVTEAFAAAEVDSPKLLRHDSALAEVNKQDALIEMGDVDINVFTDSVDNDGDLSIDAALKQDGLIEMGDLDMNVFTDSIDNGGELSIDAALGEVNEEDGLIDIADVNVNVFDNDGKLSIESFDAAGQTDLASLLDALPVKHVHHKHVDLQLVISGLVVLVAILIFVILCLVFGQCSIRSAFKYAKTLQTNQDEEDDTQSEDDELIL